MDLVTVTDHDSIDAVEPCAGIRDFFLSEEVSCTTDQRHASAHGRVRNRGERSHRSAAAPRRSAAADRVSGRTTAAVQHQSRVFRALPAAPERTPISKISPRAFPLSRRATGRCWRDRQPARRGVRGAHRQIAMAGSDAHTMASSGAHVYARSTERAMPVNFWRTARGAGHGRGRFGRLLDAHARHLLRSGRAPMREHRAAIAAGSAVRADSGGDDGEFRPRIRVRRKWGRRLRKEFRPGRRDGIAIPSAISTS